MNKQPHKSEPHQHLAKIQANLQQMKQKVTEYLQKHSKIETPSITKAKHYLIVNYINNGNVKGNSQLECFKIHQQTTPIKIPNTNTSQQHHHPHNHREVQEEQGQILQNRKKIIHHQIHSKHADENYTLTLPNICNIKLQNVQNNQPIQQHKLPLTRRRMFQNIVEDLQNHRTLQFANGRKKYHSINIKERNSICNFKPYHEEPNLKRKDSWIQHYAIQETVFRKEKTLSKFDNPLEQNISLTPNITNQTLKAKTQSQNKNYQKTQKKQSPEIEGMTLNNFLKIQHQKILPTNNKTINQIDKKDATIAETIFDTKINRQLNAKLNQKSSHMCHRRIYSHTKKQQKIISNEIDQNNCDCIECTPWQTSVDKSKNPLFMDSQIDLSQF